ncbi:ibp1 [Candida jiufengensis]|uniref:ibp1 n=1 Tax=Candida jiufengensis TaxID=497108 RepID=UPI0022248BC1|nr:ibp1 [Candida jiufengensis]KAI5955327.1 ibp1 [Candida jiufengensis]
MSRIHSISDLKYIKPQTLYQWITNKSSPPNGNGKFAIIDVRDSDYVGGHIKGSWHYPSSNFQNSLEDLQNKLYENDINNVIFHCMLSQSRGPSSTLKFLRSIDSIKNSKLKEFLEKKLNIYVLRGGFSHWQSEFGNDSNVTESYDEDIYRFGIPSP